MAATVATGAARGRCPSTATAAPVEPEAWDARARPGRVLPVAGEPARWVRRPGPAAPAATVVTAAGCSALAAPRAMVAPAVSVVRAVTAAWARQHRRLPARMAATAVSEEKAAPAVSGVLRGPRATAACCSSSPGLAWQAPRVPVGSVVSAVTAVPVARVQAAVPQPVTAATAVMAATRARAVRVVLERLPARTVPAVTAAPAITAAPVELPVATVAMAVMVVPELSVAPMEPAGPAGPAVREPGAGAPVPRVRRAPIRS